MSYPDPQAPPSPDELLGGSKFKGRSISFGSQTADPPIWHRGLIVNGPAQTVHDRDIDGSPKYWTEDGAGKAKPTTEPTQNPMWCIVVPVHTDYRSTDIVALEGEDDGQRYLWLRGSKKPDSGSILAAVAGARQRAGAKTFELGTTVDVGYVKLVPVGSGKQAKHYEATWTRPTPEQAARWATAARPSTNGDAAPNGAIPLPPEPPPDDEPPF